MAEFAPASRGVAPYYASKIDEMEALLRERSQNLRRLEAQRNELNSKGAKLLFGCLVLSPILCPCRLQFALCARSLYFFMSPALMLVRL